MTPAHEPNCEHGTPRPRARRQLSDQSGPQINRFPSLAASRNRDVGLEVWRVKQMSSWPLTQWHGDKWSLWWGWGTGSWWAWLLTKGSNPGVRLWKAANEQAPVVYMRPASPHSSRSQLLGRAHSTLTHDVQCWAWQGRCGQAEQERSMPLHRHWWRHVQSKNRSGANVSRLDEQWVTLGFHPHVLFVCTNFNTMGCEAVDLLWQWWFVRPEWGRK